MRGDRLVRLGLIGLFLGYLLVPIAATLLFSVATRWDRTTLPEGLTGDLFARVFAEDQFGATLGRSVLISIATVIGSVLLVAPTAYWVHVRLPEGRALVELVTILPFGVPAVVLALAIVRFYAGPPIDIGRTPLMLILACMVITLPFVYRPIANALDAIDVRTLTQAAQSLGARWPTILLRVVVPNIWSGIVSGSLLVFTTVFAELTLATLVTGARFKTLPMLLVEWTRDDGRLASALSVVSLIVAFAISILAISIGSRTAAAHREAVR
jgi:putative spermidine/putrescine transport system permease protein